MRWRRLNVGRKLKVTVILAKLALMGVIIFGGVLACSVVLSPSEPSPIVPAEPVMIPFRFDSCNIVPDFLDVLEVQGWMPVYVAPFANSDGCVVIAIPPEGAAPSNPPAQKGSPI